jgi:hypothetical protein
VVARALVTMEDPMVAVNGAMDESSCADVTDEDQAGTVPSSVGVEKGCEVVNLPVVTEALKGAETMGLEPLVKSSLVQWVVGLAGTLPGRRCVEMRATLLAQ